MLTNRHRPKVCIVDYGLGNIFSILNACKLSDLDAQVSANASDITNAEIVILPGVGSYSVAMDSLRSLDLISPLKEAASTSLLIGICLGMQLLMSESHEFGVHEGLGLINGKTLSLSSSIQENSLKVPHIGWNRIRSSHSPNKYKNHPELWNQTPLEGIPNNQFMYFIHSYYVLPDDPKITLSTTVYGSTEFVSSLKYNNIYGFQFHPERSGPSGIKMYDNLRNMATSLKESDHV